MKLRKRALALCAAAALLAAMPLRAQAAEAADKEEVVYINLLPDGTPDTVDVVNIFDLPQGGAIRDWGDYASVRNMTTTDPLTLEDGQVTGDVGPGKLYYEGRLENAAIPWDISIGYELDGTEVAPEELGGRSGQLTMHITAAKNPACAGTYFEDYALQISLTLDGDRAADIQAPGATMANVGGDKQLTYTVLPGKGADITLTAQVTDFAMEPIAINGLPLTLDVDVDDGELVDKLAELQQAAVDLDDGAAALSGGVDQLESGAGAVQDGSGTVGTGAAEVQYGAAALAGGIQALNDGAAAYQESLTALTGQSSALTEGSAALLAGLTQLQQTLAQPEAAVGQLTALSEASTALSEAVGTLAEGVAALQEGLGTAGVDTVALQTLIDGNNAAIEALTPYVAMMADVQKVIDLLGQDNAALSAVMNLASGLDTVAAGAAQLQEGFNAFSAQAATLSGGLGTMQEGLSGSGLTAAVDTLVEGATQLDAGLAAYTAGAALLDEGFGTIAQGAADLAAGTGTVTAGAASLQSGASSLATGAQSLSDGMDDLRSGTGALAEGTAALREQTDGMDQKVAEGIDGMLAGLTGSGEKPVSFASAKNGQVDAVQFVIRVPAIEKPAPAAEEPAPAEDEGFWQRLADLFR